MLKGPSSRAKNNLFSLSKPFSKMHFLYWVYLGGKSNFPLCRVWVFIFILTSKVFKTSDLAWSGWPIHFLVGGLTIGFWHHPSLFHKQQYYHTMYTFIFNWYFDGIWKNYYSDALMILGLKTETGVYFLKTNFLNPKRAWNMQQQKTNV